MWLLKRHPFAVDARLERTTVLTYAVPATALGARLPAALAPDSYDDWGFVAVALVQTRALRPRGLPVALGQDFFLIGYRAFVRYTTAAGRRLRGLYILGSQTDRRRMTLLGNLFTSYGYATVDIAAERCGPRQRIRSVRAGLDIEVTAEDAAPPLPAGSPFSTWAQARRFTGPLPFTFSVHPPGQVVIVEGVRERWQPQPTAVVRAEVPLLGQLGLGAVPQLASAFTVGDVPYHWKKGRIEEWTRH